MAWKIDRDYTEPAGSEYSAVGIGQDEKTDDQPVRLVGKTYNFRLKDGDGNVYYHGKVDEAGIENDEEYGGLYLANKWGEFYAGAIWLEMRVKDAIELGLWRQKYADADGQKPDDWQGIYG